jgi:hypothetical protein
MRIINDSVVIFNLLEKVNILPDNYRADKAFAFEQNKNYHLVLYSSGESNKGFTLFVIDDYKNNPGKFTALKIHLQESMNGQNELLFEEAIEEVEKMIFSLSAKNLFYDAH